MIHSSESLQIASGTQHKIVEMKRVLNGLVTEVVGTQSPQHLDPLEECIKHLANDLITAHHIPAAKVAAIRGDLSRYSAGIDVLLRSGNRTWHKPGTLEKARLAAEHNFGPGTSKEGRIFHDVIPILAFTTVALTDKELNLGAVSRQAIWFLMRPFTYREIEEYINEHAKQASASNGAFLIQTPQVVEHIVAIEDEEHKRWLSPDERIDDLRQLLLGCPPNMREVFQQFVLQVAAHEIVQRMKKLDDIQYLLQQHYLNRQYDIDQIRHWWSIQPSSKQQ